MCPVVLFYVATSAVGIVDHIRQWAWLGVAPFGNLLTSIIVERAYGITVCFMIVNNRLISKNIRIVLV